MVSMKQYLLDTNICVFLLRGQYDIDKKLDKIGLEHCYISEITEAELKYGAELGRRKGLKQRIEQLDEFLSALKILPISNAIIPIISSRPSPRKEEGGTLEAYTFNLTVKNPGAITRSGDTLDSELELVEVRERFSP